MDEARKYVYTAELVRVVNSDTVRIILRKRFSFEVDFGLYIRETVQTVKSVELNCRLYGVEVPDVSDDDDEVRTRGAAAKVELERMLGLGPLQVRTYKPDKHGRWLVDVYVYPDGEEPLHLNEELIRGGFAERHLI